MNLPEHFIQPGSSSSMKLAQWGDSVICGNWVLTREMDPPQAGSGRASRIIPLSDSGQAKAWEALAAPPREENVMKVRASQVLVRGLRNRCLNCGARTLFPSAGSLRMNRACSGCGFQFEGTGNEGFSLRATSLNFGVTVTCFLFPLLLLTFYRKIEVQKAEVLALSGALLLPLLLYRSSRSWGLMNYYIFALDELPANQTPVAPRL